MQTAVSDGWILDLKLPRSERNHALADMMFAAMRSQQYLLVLIGAVTVASGFYYYLKVVRAMYWQPAADGASAIPVPGSSKFLIALFCAGIILFGIFPQPLLAMLR